jgi:hypothetical protein
VVAVVEAEDMLLKDGVPLPLFYLNFVFCLAVALST